MRARVWTLAATLMCPRCAAAQQPADEFRADASRESPVNPESPVRSVTRDDLVRFLAGAGLGLVVRESAHVAFDEIFRAQPKVVSVHFGPVPFFAITPRRPLSPRQLFTVASAGLWTQDLTSEWLLQPHNVDLRHAHAPFAKGILAFDVLTSIGYASVAFAEAGPGERDTRGMALGLGVSERAIGLLVLCPGALDVYRYYHPQSNWAKWATRILETGSIVLIVKAPSAGSHD
jgi:hypothetical protein